MWTVSFWLQIGQELLETLYMTLCSTALAYLLGLPLGVLLVVTDKNGLRPAPKLNAALNVIVNLLRSVPFLLMMIVVAPLSRLIAGTTLGANATIVSLVCAAFPFVSRVVEGSLREVDHGVVEAAISMGASPWQIVRKVLLVEATPAYAVIECGGVGYYINISVNTYSQIVALQQVSLYIHQIVREDALLLYGFFNKEERTVFRQLISVSGIGANTASVMLSSMTVKEIAGAILTENVNAIKSVKGIGLKTAQRVIIELKDKIAVTGSAEEMNFGASVAIKEEALAALVMLGFVKAQANKVLDKIVAGGGVTSVEELIKQALKQL